MSSLRLGTHPALVRPRKVVALVLPLAIMGCRPRADLAVESGRASDSVAPHDAGVDAMRFRDAAGSATAPVASAEQRTVLETFVAAPYTYELSIVRGKLAPRDGEPEATQDSFDPFSLRLFKAGQLVDQLTLQASTCGQSSLESEQDCTRASHETLRQGLERERAILLAHVQSEPHQQLDAAAIGALHAAPKQ